MKRRKVKHTIIAFISVLFLIPTTNAYAIRDSVTTKRLGGNSRFETAVEISKEFVSKTNKKVNSIILCTAYECADSVSVTPFAVYTNSPILLTRVNSLPIETKNRINEMNVNKVYVIGGTGAISDNVVNELNNMSVTVERIGGRNRFDTNRKILDKIPNERLGNDIHIVDGYDPYAGFALALNTINYKSTDNNIKINPLILERSFSYEETKDVYNYVNSKIEKMDYWEIYFSNNFPSPSKNFRTYRLESTLNNGVNFSPTYVSLSNNNFFKDNYFRSTFSTNSIILTTANDYADVMCAGPLSAITYTPIIYIPPTANNYLDLDLNGNDLNNYTYMYKDTENIYYIGGKAVVKDNTENILRKKNIVD